MKLRLLDDDKNFFCIIKAPLIPIGGYGHHVGYSNKEPSKISKSLDDHISLSARQTLYLDIGDIS